MIKINESFKELIPPLTSEEYEGLEKSIIDEGCRDAIVLWNNTIIDGHNRYEICTKHGISFETISKEFESENDAKMWMILNQFNRRNLPAYIRGKLVLKLKPIIAEKAKENQTLSQGRGIKGLQKSANLIEPIDTRQELAKQAGVSHDTIAKIEVIEQKATPEVKRQLERQEISINKAYENIKKEEKIKERKEYIEQQKKDIENGVSKPSGKYDVIVVDPPWPYGREYDPQGSRVANPYPEMEISELVELNIPASDNCVLFLWTTHQFIWDAKTLLDAWGFVYKALLVWDKQKIGMGAWFRMQCEFCLVGIKGKPFFHNTTYRDIISEPRREHSRKPEAFYEMVNAITAGRKLDYFSRTARAGWDVIGNETNKFAYELER